MCVDLILIGPRHEVVDTVCWMILDAFEDPSRSGFGIYLVHLGSLNERISYSGRLAACLQSHEQIVFTVQGDGTDCALGCVVI